MGINTFPSTVSPVKSVQRGSAVSAGSITISAVDTTKTTVNSFATGSAGTVAATGTVGARTGSTSATSTSTVTSTTTGSWYQNQNGRPDNAGAQYFAQNQGQNSTPTRYSVSYAYFYTYVTYTLPTVNINASFGAVNVNGANVSLNSANITGGTTALATESYGAYLSNSTTLVTTGPCRYEVIEYY